MGPGGRGSLWAGGTCLGSCLLLGTAQQLQQNRTRGQMVLMPLKAGGHDSCQPAGVQRTPGGCLLQAMSQQLQQRKGSTRWCSCHGSCLHLGSALQLHKGTGGRQAVLLWALHQEPSLTMDYRCCLCPALRQQPTVVYPICTCPAQVRCETLSGTSCCRLWLLMWCTTLAQVLPDTAEGTCSKLQFEAAWPTVAAVPLSKCTPDHGPAGCWLILLGCQAPRGQSHRWSGPTAGPRWHVFQPLWAARSARRQPPPVDAAGELLP